MKMIGYLTFTDVDDEMQVFSDDYINFYNQEYKQLQEDKELKTWAVWLNSPLSYDHFKYNISFISEEKEKKWKCNYVIFGYDYVQAAIFGFGDTPQEALTECRHNFREIQERFNPEHISM